MLNGLFELLSEPLLLHFTIHVFYFGLHPIGVECTAPVFGKW